MSVDSTVSWGLSNTESDNKVTSQTCAYNLWEVVGLLPIEYRVEQLMLGHMFNIINGNAPTYLISGINMNQHRYSTRARELSCVIPRVKSSGLTSFIYQGVYHWISYHLKLSTAPIKVLINIKLSVFYIVVYLCRKPVYVYVLNFINRVFFCIFYQMMVIMYYLPCYLS